MSELPRGWQALPLGHLVSPVKNRIDPASVDGEYIGLEHIEPVTMKRIGTGHTSDVRSSLTPFKEGDVLYSKMRPYLNKVYLAVANGYCSNEFLVFPKSNKIVSKYVAYFLNSNSFVKYAMQFASGDRPRVRFSDLQTCLVPLPRLDEQAKIVEELDKQFSRLDTSVLGLSQLSGQIEKFERSILEVAFCGKLVTGENSMSVTQYLDNLPKGKAYTVKSQFEGFSNEELPELPDNWAWCRTTDICECIENGNTPKAHLMHQGGGEIPYFKVYNLSFNGLINFDYKPTYISRSTHNNILSRSKLIPGDVLINIVGPPLGKVSLVPDKFPESNTNQAVVMFRAKPNVHCRYIMYALMCPSIMTRMTRLAKATAGQYNISLSMCRSLPIPVAPKSVQDEVVSILDDWFDVAHSVSNVIRVSQTRVLRLRQCLLTSAFSGYMTAGMPFPQSESMLVTTGNVQPGSNLTKNEGMMEIERRISDSLSLVQVLRESQRPLKASELFRFVDESEDSVDRFYEYLREARTQGLISVPEAGEEEVLISVR